MLNEESLLIDLVSCTRNAFDDCRRQAASSKVAGYAILTDDSGLMYCPVICTEDELRAYPPEAGDIHRFNPEEWKIGASLNSRKAASERILEFEEQSNDEENDANWHEEYRSRVYQLFVRALESLRNSGYFNSWPYVDGLFTIVWVVDSSLPNIRGRAWSKRLNTPSVHLEFVEWLDTRSKKGI